MLRNAVERNILHIAHSEFNILVERSILFITLKVERNILHIAHSVFNFLVERSILFITHIGLNVSIRSISLVIIYISFVRNS